MKQVTIRYKSNRTLKVLKELGKYLNFSISDQGGNKEIPEIETNINGIPLIAGDTSLDITALQDVFTGKNIDTKELRNKGWLRKK